LLNLYVELGDIPKYAEGSKSLEDNEYDFLTCMVNQYHHYEMEFTSKGLILCKYNGYLEKQEDYELVAISEEYYNFPIIKLSSGFITTDDKVKKIVIPSTINELKSNSISSNTLEEIDYNATAAENIYSNPSIQNCPKLETLTIGTNVTTIPGNFISNCGITQIKIPSNVTTIGKCAFRNALNPEMFTEEKVPTTVTFEEGLKTIGSSAFNGYPIKEITIPSTVTKLNPDVFSNNVQLETVNYNATSADNIFSDAVIRNCPNFTELNIGTNVTTIPGNFISNCGITEITIPGNVTTIGSNAFKNALDTDLLEEDDLPTVTLEEGIKKIFYGAFYGYPVKEITIPSTVITLAADVFSNNEQLETVNFNATAAENIQDAAISNCPNFIELNIGINVTQIPGNFISNCGIQCITIPIGVTKINTKAFYNNDDLKELTILNNTCKIYDASTTIPDSTEIHGYKTSSAYEYSVKYNRNFVPLDCVHIYELTEKTEATCSSIGIKKYTCSICGDTKADELENLGHVWNAGEVSQEATCTEDGIRRYTCTRKNCTETKEEIIKAMHNEFVISGKAATCTATGLTAGKKCSTCGTVTVKQTVIAKKAHTVVKDSAVSPTCTKTGLTAGSHCSVCKKVIKKQETVAATGHQNIKSTTTKATLSKNGKIVKKCICGTVISTTVIKKISTVKLAKTAVVYSGAKQKVKVTVKDSAGKVINAKYYAVTYKNNTKVGKASATVKFKGNYSGTKTLTFKINPKATTIKNPVAAKKSFTAKWTKVSKQATGYQVMYATNKKFTQGKKTVTIKNNQTISKKITGLKAKKTYYVKVRTYKTVNGTKYYSAWSAVKKVTTK